MLAMLAMCMNTQGTVDAGRSIAGDHRRGGNKFRLRDSLGQDECQRNFASAHGAFVGLDGWLELANFRAWSAGAAAKCSVLIES